MFKPALNPPPVPLRRAVVKDHRHSGCTHMRMTRLYDEFGSLKCTMCHRHPRIGWLYRCTQDSNGFLPQSDFTDLESASSKGGIKHEPSLHSLGLPIMKAVDDGRYTEDQIKALIEQKERVRDTILGMEVRPPTTSNSSVHSSTFSTLPQSTTFSTNSSVSLDEELRVAYDWTELQKVWLSEPTILPRPLSRSVLDLERADVLHAVECPALPPCTFKICPTCRPTFRERAFQSLDGILCNPAPAPTWEMNNRRISDARVLSKLHWISDRDSELDFDLDNDFNSTSMANNIGGELDDEDASEECYSHSIRRRSGFRETVRKALKRARTEDPVLFSQDNQMADSPYNPSNESAGLLARSMLFMRRKSRQPESFNGARTSIVQTNQLKESLTLMLASNTPLPQGPRTPLWASERSMPFENSQPEDTVMAKRQSIISQV